MAMSTGAGPGAGGAGGPTVGVAVVGYGYWGPNLVRNLAELPDASVRWVCDLQPDRLGPVSRRYPAVGITSDYDEVLRDPAVDAVVVATPVATHYRLALAALRAGKHVLVEKPLAATSEEALELVDEAGRRGLVLSVDHTFVYTGAVRVMHELVEKGTVGDLYYFDSVRVNLGLFQHDVDVMWDLAVHDLSILDYIVPEKPVAVSAFAAAHVPHHPANVAYLTLAFESSMVAHVHVNWLAPVKVRHTLLGGSKQMIVYDDIEPSEKVRVYDRGIDLAGDREAVYEMLVSYRTGDMWAPHVDLTEALRTETAHFLRCITDDEQPLTGGEEGLRVVRTLEAAARSIEQQGRLVEIVHD